MPAVFTSEKCSMICVGTELGFTALCINDDAKKSAASPRSGKDFDLPQVEPTS